MGWLVICLLGVATVDARAESDDDVQHNLAHADSTVFPIVTAAMAVVSAMLGKMLLHGDRVQRE